MLVLTREAGNSLKIFTESGEEIEITVSKLSRKRASIGIKAPKGFRIVRSELAQRDPVIALDGPAETGCSVADAS